MSKVIVIGGGPAGISAAIQLKRFDIDVTIIEKDSIGGLIKNANLIENYLGFPSGITGIEYTNLIKKQLEQYNIPVFYEEVKKISKNKVFELSTNLKNFKCNYLVVATGTVPKKADFPLDENVSAKIFYDIQGLSNVKNKNIAIIGAGDAAFDYTSTLLKSNKITILNRSVKPKALPLLIERAKCNKNVCYIENIKVKKVSRVSKKLILETTKNKIEVDYIILAIGRVPNDKFLTENLKNDPDFYMIGDVKNGILRQTAIATGDGLKVAQQIYDREKHS